MRRRIGDGLTGFGNPDTIILDNVGTINEEFAQDALETYFSKEEGFDFQIHPTAVSVGIEPTYQGDPLKILSIHRTKEKSTYETGRAWGAYGSGITKKVRTYSEYKNKSKFVRFVDKWHAILFPTK